MPWQLKVSYGTYVIFTVIQMLTVAPCCCLEVEKLARTLFLWKIEVHEQKEKVYEMRRWNEALVTNMLPEHVARHFLGSKKRDEVRPLFELSCHFQKNKIAHVITQTLTSAFL